MNNYIITALDEDTSEPVAYFDGSILQDDLQKAFIYDSKSDARRVVGGGVQSTYSDRDLRIMKVERTIKLAE